MSLRNRKLFAGFVGVALSLVLVAGVAVPSVNAAALTSAQVSAIISLLQSFGADQATINNVQASLTGGTVTPTTPATGATGYVFTRDLKVGSTGDDVKNLQKVLNMDVATQVAVSGAAGSPGNETSTFGPATKAAVIKFQNKYASETLTPIGLTAGTGYVGAMTRAKLNTMTGGVVVTPPGTVPVTPTGTGLTVSDPGQPGVSLAPEAAARVPFTKVRLTAGNDGDVTVNSITVERTGLAQDAVFSGIVLVDENGLQIGDSKTFNSNHQATVGVPFTVKAGTSRVLTLAGNMAATLDNYAGGVATLTVVGINTNGAVVSGTLPITGAAQTINATLSIGSVTLNSSSYDPNTSATKEIGTTGYKFSGFRLTAGSAEKVRLWSVRWYQSGSAGSSDLANVQTYVDGIAYPTTIDSTGKYYTALFPGGLLMDKGESRDVWISADVVGSSAATRTVEFDVYKSTDVYLTGETYGYGVGMPAGTNTLSTTAGARTSTTLQTTTNPYIAASTVTISAGSATAITKATAVPAQNIAVNVSNQPLGGFMTDIKGEPISVQSLVFTVSTSTGTFPTNGGLLTNVTIVDQNGAVVAGPVDATDVTADSDQTLTFTDTITFPVGQRVYTLKGKVPTGVGGNMTYIVKTTPNTNWTNVTGLVTGNTITLPSALVTMNTMTVKSGALTVTMSSTPAAQSIVAGGTARTFANYQFDASQSGEDVRFSSMKGSLTFDTGLPNELSGCQIYDGGTALNTTSTVNPESDDTTGDEYTFTFDQALTIPKGSVKTLTLKCNVSGNATSGAHFAWGIENTAANIVVTGVTSGSAITESVTAALGQTMTLGSGSVAVSTGAASPSYTIVAAGTTGQAVADIKFRATNESVNLNKLGLALTNTASSSASDLVQVTVWDGATQVGYATFTGNNTVATSTFSSAVLLPKDTDKVLTVKLDLAEIGVSSAATSSGKLIAIDFKNAEGAGAESGVTISGSTAGGDFTGSTSVAGVRMMKSYPVVAQDTLSSNGIADGKLLRFKVTANSKGNVGLGRVEVSISTTSATVTGINVYGYTDAAYSQPISSVNTGGGFLTTNACASGCSSNGPTLAFYPQTTAGATTTVQIPAGSTYYFEVRGTVTGSGTSYSISTTLNGDNAYPSLDAYFTGQSKHMGPMYNTVAASTVDTGTINSFLWSPNSTTTSATSGNDWTNGYGLQGLGASGITQTRTQ